VGADTIFLDEGCYVAKCLLAVLHIGVLGLGTLLSGLGLKHMRIRSHHDLAGTLVIPYSWEDHGGVLRLLPVYPSQCSLLQVTSTDVAFPPFCRSCPCDRHDLYLPSIPASQLKNASLLFPHTNARTSISD
jgi:hypothetical protein